MPVFAILAAFLMRLATSWSLWGLALVTLAFTAFEDLAKDLALRALDAVLGLVIRAIGAVDVPTYNAQQAIDHLPAEMLRAMAVLRLPECMAIIVAALVIRFGMGLIPVLRVGK